MCEICDAVTEREVVVIECAYCHVPIETVWAANGGGLLHGDYDLVGDYIFHKPCWEKVIEEFPCT